ncbi:MAG: hypothetical protein JRC69_04510 [Deltaproteobacteria bacterium]|nr:hypothetical protein [Deltaproteobacteria bacterium]
MKSPVFLLSAISYQQLAIKPTANSLLLSLSEGHNVEAGCGKTAVFFGGHLVSLEGWVTARPFQVMFHLLTPLKRYNKI